MAHVVETRPGYWEVRESRATRRGPRSRTLAGFRELTAEIAERAAERSGTGLSTEDVRSAARRVGAPVADVGHAAARLVEAVRSEGPLSPGARRVLLTELGAEPRDPVTDGERAAAEWLGAPAERRGDALRDLLLLADRIPQRRRGVELRFPRIDTRAA